MKQVLIEDFPAWRTQARELIQAGVEPSQVHFVDGKSGQPLLFDEPAQDQPKPEATKVPAEFLKLASVAAQYRDPDRWDLLYSVLHRLTNGEPYLLKIDVDSDIRRLRLMEKAIRRDIHKMHAFVRFRKIELEGDAEYIAWHRPDHYIVRAATPFFARRFGNMRWAILTPDESAYWDGAELIFGPGAPRDAAPDDDGLEDLWRTYYASIFNPARINLRAMRAEMPVRHWATLPEAQIISNLAREAGFRVQTMIKDQAPSALPWVPQQATLQALREAAIRCEGCELHKCATQVVFGAGPEGARVVLVGEQPGDEEDLAGSPFVGPAGRLLSRALEEAEVDRSALYVTNAVKHFKFIERGKRRIHAKPGGIEISACRPWLEAELEAVKPELVVCLGATAAQSLMGRDFRVTRDRGQFQPHRWAKQIMATIHPSALLRMPEPDRREQEYRLFVHDLALIRPYMQT